MSQVAVNPADLAVVVALACETGDRSNAEQKALMEVARRLDDDRNRMASGNGRVDGFVSAGARNGVPCTYSTHHARSMREAARLGVDPCKCHGDDLVYPFTEAAKAEALTDDNGWSRAVDAVRETLEKD